MGVYIVSTIVALLGLEQVRGGLLAFVRGRY